MATPNSPSRFVPWLVLASIAPAQHDVAEVLPASSWAYVDLAGLDQQTATFRDASLVGLVRKILGEEGAKNLEAMVLKQGGREIANAQRGIERLGIEPGQLRSLLAGGIALGVGRPVFMGENPIPSLALITVASNEQTAPVLPQVVERLLQQAPPMQRGSQAIGGVEFARVDLPQGGQILYGTHGRFGLLSNSAGYLAECLATMSGRGDSLAHNADLARGREAVHGKRMATLFVHADPFAAALTPILPYEAADIGKALGIAGAPNLFVSMAHDGKNACDVFELSLPGPTDGLLKCMLSKPVSNQAARWVKRSTALFMSAALDTDAVKLACDRLLASLPPRAARELERDLRRELGGPNGQGLQHLQQIAAALGGEISLACDLPQPLPPFVTFTGFVQIRDMAAAEAMLRQVASSGHVGEVQFEEIDGAKMWSMDVHMRDLRISPTVALRDGWLVFSNFKNVVKRHLRSGDLGDESLAADPRFQTAVKSAPHAGFFATCRFQAALEAYWGLATTGIRAGASQIGFEPDQLPDADTVCDAVDDVVIAAMATEHGFTLRVQQPLGFGTLLPAGASALDWLLAVAGGKTPTGGKKIY